MADNVPITAGSGTDIATDDVSGVHYQKVKLAYGAADAATLVESAAPLPVTVPAGASSIGKAEDVAHASGDVGVMALAVRDDTLDARSGTEGDYEPLHTGATGALWVEDVNAGAIKTAVQAVANSTSSNKMQTDIVSALPAGTNNIGAVDVLSLPALPAGTNAIGKLAANSGVDIGDVDVTSLPVAFNTGTRSATTQRVTIATDDVVPASQSGTWTVQPGNTANTTAWKVDGSAVTQPVSMATNTPLGNVAHDAGDSGAPVKVGLKAENALSGITLVADGDRTDAYGDLDGVQLNRLNGAIGDYVNGNASNTDGTNTQVLAAGAAGVKHYLTDITISNTSASNIYVEIKDGTTVKWTFPVPANSGVTHSWNTPIGGTAATAWNFDPSAATSTVYCSVSGFKSKI